MSKATKLIMFITTNCAFKVFSSYNVNCFLSAIFTKMIHVVRDESNILWFISFYGDNFLPYWLTKPLWNCPVCMSSVWGLWFWMFHPWQVVEIKHWVFYTLALAGICWLIGIIWEQKEMRANK